MPIEPLLLIGSGGHARVVYDALRRGGHAGPTEVRDDDAAREGVSFDDLRVATPALPSSRVRSASVHVAVGDNRARSALARRAVRIGGKLVTAVHPHATVADNARIGFGCFLAAGCIVGPGAELGMGCIVNHGAVVDHDCKVEDWCHLAPGTVLGGGACVREGALIGAGAVILPGRVVGAWAVVGAGAVVTYDVADRVTVAGVPARVIREHAKGP